MARDVDEEVAVTVVIVCGNDALREEIVSSLESAAGGEARIVGVATAGACRAELDGLAAPVVVVAPPIPDADLASFVAEAAGPPVGARVVTVVPQDEGIRGYELPPREPVSRLIDRILRPGDAEPLDRNEVRRLVSRVRHDVNNPLTSALAETQLLLMDVPEGEVREGLEQIQTQLRRIRDLVAELNVIPRPS